MKRGEPPRRLTPLKRSTKPIKRSRVARKSDKKRIEDNDEAACRNTVIDRAHGMCEVPMRVYDEQHRIEFLIPHSSTAEAHAGTMMHHKWPRDRRARRHEPARCVWSCFKAHRWIHDNPALAKRAGMLRPDS